MKYRYLVISNFGKSSGVTGINEDCIDIDFKLDTIENINKVREIIKHKYDFETLVIVNIMRLKK